jgi:methionyl-tRNA formyltransferase
MTPVNFVMQALTSLLLTPTVARAALSIAAAAELSQVQDVLSATDRRRGRKGKRAPSKQRREQI